MTKAAAVATTVTGAGVVGPVLTVEEAARYLRISRGLAFAAVRDGSIPSIRIGRRILVPRSRLDAMLDGGAAQ
jgi:excisionase family DNA binding protein